MPAPSIVRLSRAHMLLGESETALCELSLPWMKSTRSAVGEQNRDRIAYAAQRAAEAEAELRAAGVDLGALWPNPAFPETSESAAILDAWWAHGRLRGLHQARRRIEEAMRTRGGIPSEVAPVGPKPRAQPALQTFVTLVAGFALVGGIIGFEKWLFGW